MREYNLVTENRLTPQQRWQTFRARLPAFTRRQQFVMILGTGIFILTFAGCILPFLLPSGGIEEYPVEDLADSDGIFIEINEQRIYAVHQPGEGEPVLFIHGFGASSVSWRDILSALGGYDRYAIDLPGFGLSQKGLDLDLRHQTQAEIILAFMDVRQIDSAHIVAHDMGGNIAMHLAQRHPERILSLTLVAPALQYDSAGQLPQSLLDFAPLQRWGRILVRWIIPSSTEINLQSAIEQDAVIDDDLIEAYQRTYRTPDWDLSILALARDSSQSALAQPLQSLSVPVLIIWGESDKWIAPGTAEQIETDIPDARRVMLPGVGHLPMHEVPDQFTAVLLDFWNE